MMKFIGKLVLTLLYIIFLHVLFVEIIGFSLPIASFIIACMALAWHA